MRCRGIYFCSAWLLLCSGCSVFDKFDEKPAFLDIKGAYYFLNERLGDTTSQGLKDIWVYQYPSIQGVYELPTNFPVLNSTASMYIFQGGVFENGLSGVRRPYPFWESDTAYLSFSPEKTTTYTPKFHYYPDTTLIFPISEDFEGLGVNFQQNGETSDTVKLDVINTDAFRGQKCASMSFDSTHLQFFQISTQPLNLPTDREVWLEITLKGDVYLEVGLEYHSTTTERVMPFAAYAYPERWNTVFFNISPLTLKYLNSNKYLILRATGDKKERFLRLDNIRIIYAK